MARTYANSIVIDKPLEEVWAFLEDPRNHISFLSGLLELDTDPPGQAWEVGTKIVGKRELALGQTVAESGIMVEKVTNSNFVWDATVLGSTSRASWRVEPVEGGTKATLSVNSEESGLMRLLNLFGIVDVDETQRKVLENLRQTLTLA